MSKPYGMTTGRRAGFLALGLLATAALAGCEAGDDTAGGADHEGGPTSGQTMDPAAGAGPSGLMALDPWVRVSIGPEAGSEATGRGATGAPDAAPTNAAAYLVVRNAGSADDAITSVETEAADTAELHSASMEGGVARMRPVDAVPLTAGGDAVLEPGGHHIMLVGLRRPLAEGDSVPLTLRLRSGDSLRVMAPVLRSPPQM